MLVQGEFPGDNGADKGVQRYGKIGIVMAYGRQRPADRYSQVQLFSHFTDDALLGRLVLMNFSAGKLPFQRQIHALAALDSQNPAVMLYDGERNPQRFF